MLARLLRVFNESEPGRCGDAGKALHSVFPERLYVGHVSICCCILVGHSCAYCSQQEFNGGVRTDLEWFDEIGSGVRGSTYVTRRPGVQLTHLLSRSGRRRIG